MRRYIVLGRPRVPVVTIHAAVATRGGVYTYCRCRASFGAEVAEEVWLRADGSAEERCPGCVAVIEGMREAARGARVAIS